MEMQVCKNCGFESQYKTGEKNGKKWAGNFCQNPQCKFVDWVNTSPQRKVYPGQKPAYQPYKPPVSEPSAPVVKPVKDDCTISALAIVKSLIESKFYNYDAPQEDTIEKIWEHLVLLRERFRKYE